MWPPGDVTLTVVRNIARCLFYCAARMVRTGTATDAVTIAAVTNAARALMMSSLMKSSPCGLYDHVLVVSLPLALCTSVTARIVTYMRIKVTLL